jgi:hypothetical protein
MDFVQDQKIQLYEGIKKLNELVIEDSFIEILKEIEELNFLVGDIKHELYWKTRQINQ